MKTIIELPTHKRDSNEFASEVHQEEASRAHCLLLDEAAAIGAIVSQSPSFAEGGIAPWTGRLQHDPSGPVDESSLATTCMVEHTEFVCFLPL